MNEEKLDIAQQIAAAVSATGDPKQPTNLPPYEPEDGGEVLGELPMHLRHLYNYLEEILFRVQDADEESKNDFYDLMVVRKVFWSSVKQRFDREELDRFAICADWKVVGFTDSIPSVTMIVCGYSGHD